MLGNVKNSDQWHSLNAYKVKSFKHQMPEVFSISMEAEFMQYYCVENCFNVKFGALWFGRKSINANWPELIAAYVFWSCSSVENNRVSYDWGNSFSYSVAARAAECVPNKATESNLTSRSRKPKCQTQWSPTNQAQVVMGRMFKQEIGALVCAPAAVTSWSVSTTLALRTIISADPLLPILTIKYTNVLCRCPRLHLSTCFKLLHSN